jgi:hypothetical protein
LKGATKKYASDYLNYHAVDLEEAKTKKSDSWTKAKGAKKEQLEAAWKKKKEQLKTILDNSDEKMSVIGDKYGVNDLVPIYRNKAKLAGAKKVLDLSQNLLSDSAKAELQNTYDQLVIKDKKNTEVLKATEKEDKDNFDNIKKDLEAGGFEEKSAEAVKDIDKQKYSVVAVSDKENKKHFFVLAKDKMPAEQTDAAPDNSVSEPTDKKKPTVKKTDTKKADIEDAINKLGENQASVQNIIKQIDGDIQKRTADKKGLEEERDAAKKVGDNTKADEIQKEIDIEMQKAFDELYREKSAKQRMLNDIDKQIKAKSEELDKINK